MKKLFIVAAIISFLWGAVAFAWQDPCSAIQYEYVCEEYTLTSWEESTSYFSPAPRCSGTVLLLAPDNTWVLLDYKANEDTIVIAGIPCRVSDKGDLICKIITQPEKSEILYLERKE